MGLKVCGLVEVETSVLVDQLDQVCLSFWRRHGDTWSTTILAKTGVSDDTTNGVTICQSLAQGLEHDSTVYNSRQSLQDASQG